MSVVDPAAGRDGGAGSVQPHGSQPPNEYLAATSEAVIQLAMSLLLLRRLTSL
jgi:hypothetical protein